MSRRRYEILRITTCEMPDARCQMPDRVHQSVHDGGSENAARLTPSAALKNSCYRREDSVTPVWKNAVVGDVREAENDGGCEPAPVSFESVREREFCSKPRNKSSSGHAVSRKMEIATKGRDFQRQAQLDRKKKGEHAQSESIRAPAVSVPRAIHGRSSNGRGPQAERGPNG
jgi:hypothetical protein